MTPHNKFFLSRNHEQIKTIAAEYADWCRRNDVHDHADWDKFVEQRIARDWLILTTRSTDSIEKVFEGQDGQRSDRCTMRDNGLYLNEISDGTGHYSLDKVMDGKHSIVVSVQTQAGEVLSVGDSVLLNGETHEIKELMLSSSDTILASGDSFEFKLVEISQLRKVKPSSTYTTTGDSVAIHPGDKFYGVAPHATGINDQFREMTYSPPKLPSANRVTFASREKAVEYLLDNARVFSIGDLMQAHSGDPVATAASLKGIVRDKIGVK